MNLFQKHKTLRNFLIYYSAGLIVCVGILLCTLISKNVPLNELPGFIWQLLAMPLFWILGIITGTLFLSIRYFYQTLRIRGPKIFFQKLSLFLLLPIALIFSSYKVSQWYTHSEDYDYTWNEIYENPGDSTYNYYDQDQKQRGMHFFGTSAPEEGHYKALVKTNIEWLVHVPYGWQKDVKSTDIKLSFRSGGTYRRDQAISNTTRDARRHGIRSIMKPHLWLTNRTWDEWRGTMSFENPEDWKNWSENYRRFILHYAKISAKENIEAFCIGTELHQIAVQHPKYWRELIREVRSFYKGKIIYAANWNKEYEEITFWDELDYIGIQAYFPLTDQTSPSVRTLIKGWQPHVKKMKAISQKYGKPILFTEIGYKSTDDAAIDPWKWVDAVSTLFTKQSYQTQVNCYEAFFKVFWKKDWFAGALFWEWKAGINTTKGKENISFTPQNKPAENVLAKWFGKSIKR